MKNFKHFTIATICIGCSLLAGCDPNKVINRFFTDLGLNRLAILRTDIKPGAVILADTKKTMYAGNMSKYVQAMPAASDAPESAGSFSAVIPKYTAQEGLDASSSLKFLDSVLPISLSGSLKLNGTVSLDQVEASVQRIDPADIEAILNDSGKSAQLVAKLQDRWDGNSDIYIAYETYAAKKFSLKTTSDTNIAPEISVGKTKVIASGSAKFTITHSSTSELTVDGDTAYVFAFRAAKVEPRGGTWRLRIMAPPPNFGSGTKAEADEYSAFVGVGSGPVTLADRPNGLD
jgi:hypothetical protein